MPILQQRPKYYTVEDFNRLPEDYLTELIAGSLYHMEMPGTLHQEILGELSFIIHDYIETRKKDCELYTSLGVQLWENEDTVLIPDISVICDKSKLNERGCLGTPDWIIEIVSSTSARHDYIEKLNLYIHAGVREYWIVDPQNANVLVYQQEPKHFHVGMYSFQDAVKAGIFEELLIDFAKFDLCFS